MDEVKHERLLSERAAAKTGGAVTIEMVGELICEESALDPSLRGAYTQFKTLFNDVNGSSVSHVRITT